jgi:hypothetical protein
MVHWHEKEEEMNKWQKIKIYINNKEIGSIITRKELFYLIHKGPAPRTSSYGTTIDNYRRCLTILGILSSTIVRGVYEVQYHIKDTVSSSELKSIAYGGYREWFNDIKVEG